MGILNLKINPDEVKRVPVVRIWFTGSGKCRALFFIMALLFLSGNIVIAQNENSPVIGTQSTLEDLLAYGAINNPGLEAAFNSWKAALERLPQVKALPDPQFNYAVFIRAIETRVGPQRQKVGIMQMFPWFGKLKLREDRAFQMAEMARQRYENRKLALFYRIKVAFYDHILAQRTIQILQENLHLLESMTAVVKIKYENGSANLSHLIRIQLEMDQLQERLKTARESLAPIGARLNAALNRSSGEPLPVRFKTVSVNKKLELERLKVLLRKNNRGLKELEAKSAVMDIGVKMAKKDAYPDFSIGLDYVLTAEGSMPGVSDNGKDPLVAMLSLRIPLWSKKNRARRAEAELRLKEVSSQKEEKLNLLTSTLEALVSKYDNYDRKIVLYETSLIPRSRLALTSSQRAFEVGKTDYLNLIDSQRVLLNMELMSATARMRQLQSLAELEWLVGTPLQSGSV